MRGHIPRTDKLSALQRLVEEEHHTVTVVEFNDLLRFHAWRCILWLVRKSPRYAYYVGPYNGDTPLHFVANSMSVSVYDGIDVREELVAALVAACTPGAPMQQRNMAGEKPIDGIWREAFQHPDLAPRMRAMSELFIDYGAWPIAGHKPTLQYWEQRIAGFKALRLARACLLNVALKHYGVPRDVGRLLVSDQVLMEPRAWRAWRAE